MPRYEITDPSGKRYEITAPEGATQEQVLAYAQQQFQSQPKEWQPTRRTPEDIRAMAGKVDPTEGMSFGQQWLAGYGKAYNDTYDGLRQIGAAGLDKVFGGDRSAAVQADVDQSRQLDAALAASPGGKAGKWSGGIVQLATPGTNAGKLVQFGGKVGQPILQGAAQGGVYGAIQPTATGESRVENTITGTAFGGIGGAAAPMIAKAGGKLADAVRPEVQALYEAAKARGINLTPAQLSDSRAMKFLASMLQGLPGSGAKAKAAEQSAAFNREVAREIGSDAPVVTPEVYAGMKRLQSKHFEALTSRNDLKVTPELFQRLENAAKEAETAGPEVASAVRSAVDRFYAAAQTGERGVFVPGKAYQALDSSLGQVTKRGDTTAHFVGQVKGAIREAMDASISPRDKAAWDALRRQYGNRKTIRDLVAKADGGELPPAQLMGRVTANNAGKEAMATGSRGGLGELARIGQRIKEPPSSGTAERMLAAQSLNPLAWPIMGARAVVGSTAGRALNSSPLAELLASGSGGRALEGLARLVDKSKPQYLLPAGAFALPAQAQPNKDKKKPTR